MAMQQPPQIPENPYAAPQANVADFAQADQLELAGRGMRLVGVIVDGLIMMILTVPLMFGLGYWQLMMSGQQPGMGLQIGMGLSGFIIFLLINGYFLNQSGQTVAKKLLGMRIVDLNGNKPEFFRLVGLRYGVAQLIQLIPVVNVIYALVDCLFIFREDRRCVHDLIAGTRVVVV
jgi:uncharacterized RDD family membrane protein YckC